MPTNNDDLVISISTDLTTIKRQLRELGQSITQATDGATKRFSTLGQQIDQSLTPVQKRINQMVGIPVPTNIKAWKGALADVATETELVTRGFKLNRQGLMELQASGVNTFQALASGMSLTRVAEMEGAQVIGAVIQGTEGGIAGLGKSFISLVGGPIPAVGLALAAVGAAGALAFLEIDKSAISAKDAAALFKDQLGEIKKAAPDVAKSVEAIFNSPGSTNTILAGLKLTTTELQGGIKKSLTDLESKVPRSAGIFGGVGDYKGYQQVLNLVDEAKNGTITVAKLRDELGKIYLDPNATKSVSELAGKILEASKEAQGFENELNALKAASASISDVDEKFNKAQKAIDAIKSASAQKELQGLFDKAKNGEITTDDLTKALADLGLKHLNLSQQIDEIGKLEKIAIDAQQAVKGVGYLKLVGNLGQLSPVYSDNGRIENPQEYQVSSQQQAQLEAAGQSAAAAMIKGFESFSAGAYWDKNHYRAGFGSSTTTDINGNVSEVTKDTVVTLDEAQRDLSRRIIEFQTGIQKAIGIDTWKSLSDGQQAALTDIAYNYGSLPKRVITAIKAGGGPQAVAQAIAALATDNGGINAGRRKSEAQSYLSGTGYTLKSAGITTDNRVRGLAGAFATTDKQIAEMQAKAAAYSSLTPAVNDYGLAVATAAKEEQLLAAARADGTINNPGVKESIEAEAQAYGKATAAMNGARVAQDNLNKSIDEMRQTARDAMGTFISEMENGKSASQALGDALKQVADKLMNIALDDIFGTGNASVKAGGSGGVLGGLFSGLGKLLGGIFDEGGYTGPGGKYQPAGIVHKGEVVWSQDDIRRAGGVGVVEGMRRSMRGYANGGFVAPTMPSIPSIARAQPVAATGALSVHVTSEVVNGNLVPTMVHVSGTVAGQQIKQANRILPQRLSSQQKRGV